MHVFKCILYTTRTKPRFCHEDLRVSQPRPKRPESQGLQGMLALHGEQRRRLQARRLATGTGRQLFQVATTEAHLNQSRTACLWDACRLRRLLSEPRRKGIMAGGENVLKNRCACLLAVLFVIEHSCNNSVMSLHQGRIPTTITSKPLRAF